MPEEQKKIQFTNRSLCSGNVSNFFILPDGMATICEQLYWHPEFIIGDAKKQSIMEIWNSDKAMRLWNFTHKDVVNKESPCSDCEQIDECRRGLGVCWKIVLGAYGMDKYDYPVPDCPYAPPIKNNIYID
ncbi:MAG: radical SAM protein [Marinilabiliales bacterium]|nr:MAG: radical SAM protein [Marinilabiliales bacterium]